MKQDVFHSYADQVAHMFGIKREELFSKSKKRDIVDARYLLYYLCHQRPMRVSYIKRYMCENGYDIHHSTIVYGINTTRNRIEKDADYIKAIKSINNSI